MTEIAIPAAEIAKALRPERVIEILPLAEAAKTLHVKPCTLRRMVEKGKIGFIADAKSYFFKVSDLNEYINKHYHEKTGSEVTQ
jgi:excisionase family DNA binding protein